MQTQWRNTTQGYGWISIVLHWVTLPPVLFLLGSGIYMVTLTYYDPLYHRLPHWHKLVGVATLLVTLLRLAWLATNPKPAVLALQHWQRQAAHLAHVTLYLALLALAATGYAITTAKGQSIALFWGLELPALGTLSPETTTLLGDAHRWIAYAMGVLILGHAGAALLHHFHYRDTTMKRMLWPGCK